MASNCCSMERTAALDSSAGIDMLNTGFRVPANGAADYPACRMLSDCKTYVYADERPTMEEWLRGMAKGKSFFTSGPLLLLGSGWSKAGCDHRKARRRSGTREGADSRTVGSGTGHQRAARGEWPDRRPVGTCRRAKAREIGSSWSANRAGRIRLDRRACVLAVAARHCQTPKPTRIRSMCI